MSTAVAPSPTGSSQYRWVSEIARGGMGRVDLVLRQEGRFGRLHAMKRLHPAYRDEPELRAMFVDEARIAGLIRHPNVVSVLDVGEDGEGPFLLMDYVDGVSVTTLVSWANRECAALPVQLCAQIARQVAEGLHAAHELTGHDGAPLSIVHRDVSPPNILVGFDGVVRVTDFGIAKAFGRTTRTTTGLLKGKVGYMSPEQLRFEEPDRRSDVFSLGVVLYELLAARRLYPSSEGPGSARRILNEPPPDIGEVRDDVPAALVELLFEMLAKEPEHRPPDARSVARRLEVIVTDLAAEEGPVRLDEYLEARFSDARAMRRQTVTRALASLDGGSWRTPGATEGSVGDLATMLLTRATTRPRGRVPRWVAAAGAVALVAIVAAAIWLTTGSSDPHSEQGAETSSRSATSPADGAAAAASSHSPVRASSPSAMSEANRERADADSLRGSEWGVRGGRGGPPGESVESVRAAPHEDFGNVRAIEERTNVTPPEEESRSSSRARRGGRRPSQGSKLGVPHWRWTGQ